jgi:hypothetical protein
MMWNPPWTLPLTMLLAQFPWRLGQLLWLAANLAAVAGSALLLWRLYAGEWKRAGLAVVVALAFAPTPFLLMLGQISGFLLLGLVGFLWAVKSERWALAGALAALTAIKPHLLVPFALVLVLQSLRGNAVWKSIVAGGAVLVVFGLIPLAWDSAVWSQYRAGTAAPSTEKQPSVRDWEHPTLGYMIRDALPGRPFAAMFLPLGVALPLVAVYWWVRREKWDWGTELPRLVLVSLVAAPYGAWVFDLVLLLVPVIQATTWIANDPRRMVWMLAGGVYLVLNLLAFGSMENAGWTANPWIVPLTVAGYIAASLFTKVGVTPAPVSR